jgi:DNA-binding MarR family transcriptional regulator
VTSKSRQELMDAINLEVRRAQNRSDAYDEAVAEALGINRTDQRCIDVLDQEGPTTAGRLAELLGLTSGAITTVLDRLELAGYARRVRDEADRRRVTVELTDEARAAGWEFYEPMLRMAEELYSRYTDDELALLLDFLETAATLGQRNLAALRERLAQR